MECPGCALRYNQNTRKPKVYSCSHSLCQLCSGRHHICPECKVELNHKNAFLNSSLMKIIQQDRKNIDKLLKACFVGSSHAGKTTLIKRLKGECFQEQTSSTIGCDFVFVDRQIERYLVRFQLWDTAGQQRFAEICSTNYKNADIVLIVYDMTEDACKDQVAYWLQQSNLHSPQHVVKILVGNKLDLVQELGLAHKCPVDQQMLKSENISHYQISCKTNDGVQQLWLKMDSIIKTILDENELQAKSIQNKNNTTKLTTQDVKVSTETSTNKTCSC